MWPCLLSISYVSRNDYTTYRNKNKPGAITVCNKTAYTVLHSPVTSPGTKCSAVQCRLNSTLRFVRSFWLTSSQPSRKHNLAVLSKFEPLTCAEMSSTWVAPTPMTRKSWWPTGLIGQASRSHKRKRHKRYGWTHSHHWARGFSANMECVVPL